MSLLSFHWSTMTKARQNSEYIGLTMMWKILSETGILSITPWFNITVQRILLPDGREIDDYYQINQPSYCEIAVKDKTGRFLIHETYKHGVRTITLGFPGGYINEGESPQKAAMRELHEECGLSAENWKNLGSYVIDGNRGEARVHMFLAEDIANIEKIASDDLEEAKTLWVSEIQLKNYAKNDCFKTLGARLLVEKIVNGL